VKILTIGDPHLRATHLKDGIDLLRWIESVVADVKPDLVVNLGDSLDSHAIIRSEVMCELSRHLDIVTSDLGVPVVMVLGNHDQYKPNDAKYHALEVFKHRKLVTVADKPMVVDGIGYVPYLCTGMAWPKVDAKLVFTHNTFLGANYGFKLANDGIVLPMVSDDGIYQDVIVSGHIHLRQLLEGGAQTSIIYPGTPRAISASDAGQSKGLMLIDSETYETRFIESPFPVWRTLEHAVGNGSIDINDKDHWVVTLTGTRSEIKAFLEDKTTQALKRTHSVTFKTAPVDTVKSTKVRIQAPTVEAMVDQYVDVVYKGTQDRAALKATLGKFIEEARKDG
jgi:DNA repair exonuclease SbcCD nuclease subunit